MGARKSLRHGELPSSCAATRSGVPNLIHELHTARLILEPLTVAHAVLLHAGFDDQRLYRYIPQTPLTLEQRLDRHRRLEARRSADGRQIWLNWAVKRKAPAAYVGAVEATIHADGSADIAYFIFAGFWRQGLAKESCLRLCSHLLEERQLSVIRARIDTRNAPSIALIEALGFARLAWRKMRTISKAVQAMNLSMSCRK